MSGLLQVNVELVLDVVGVAVLGILAQQDDDANGLLSQLLHDLGSLCFEPLDVLEAGTDLR